MKIIISYPPLDTSKGVPLLSQNRQFQYFKEPTFIYPVVPATAATMLKDAGFTVIWNDCIAKNWSINQFYDFIREENPDLIAIETKTPVIKQHWEIINNLKSQNPKLQTVLFGDHVTAMPEESFVNSNVDFVLTGGDYDFLLLNLCNILKLQTPNSQLQTQNLEPGIYYRNNAGIKNTGKFELNHNLNSLPVIDRKLTHWQDYAFKNGNFKRTSGAYIMSGRDCWWGQCTFCSWPTLYPRFRVRTPDKSLKEINHLVSEYGIREVMDDTGCFPTGDWLKEFCSGMVREGLNKKVYFDCNMRFGALTEDDFVLMKKANFRLLLFGLESANQNTLDRLKKNLKKERIIEDCKLATKSGLFPHITVMFGYPWETCNDSLETLKLGKWLLEKGYAYTMQATIVIPYPGTKLFEECKNNGWLKTLNWDDYDMKTPVMKTPFSPEMVLRLPQEMYKVSYSPEFVLRKILSVRDWDDFKYYFRAARKIFGHIFDFSGKKRREDKCCGK